MNGLLKEVEQIKLDTLFRSGQAAPYQVAAPQPVPGGPAVQQVERPAPKPEEPPKDDARARQEAVRMVVQELRQIIVGLAREIYQMQLTEEQVSELADKMLHQVADSINEITVERVKDIANDLLIGVDENRSYKRRR